MQMKLDDLKKKCQDLGLSVSPQKGRASKKPFTDALREHFMKIDYPNGLPYEEISPMLCFPSWDLSQDEEKKIMASPSWGAQEKINGARGVLHLLSSGTYLHSRFVSVKTFRMQELGDHLLFGDQKWSREIVLDVEIIIEKSVDTRPYTAKGEVTKSSLHSTVAVLHLAADSSKRLQKEQDTPLRFKILDILRVGDKDLRGMKLRDRIKRIDEVQKVLDSHSVGQYFDILQMVTDNKREFLAEILKKGGEGLVLKNLDSTYESSTSRNRDGWVKFKRRREVDAFVTGYKLGEEGSGWENLIGALEFSVKTEDGSDHVIAYPTNITLEQRKKLTVLVNGQPTLHPKIYGLVAQVSGQDFSARALRLTHATIDRWRIKEPDRKLPEDCLLNLASVRTAAEWVS